MANIVIRAHEWLAHDKAFTSILRDMCALDPEFIEAIATQLEVQTRTVERWCDGSAVPHRDIQTRIISALATIRPHD